MKNSFSEESSLIDFVGLLLSQWKKLVIISLACGTLFYLLGKFVIPTKYYSELTLAGDFSIPLETEFGDFHFSSGNIADYTNTILDENVLEKTRNYFSDSLESSTVQLDYKIAEKKDFISGTLMAFTIDEDVDLQAYLNQHFEIFLTHLNDFTFNNFMNEALKRNKALMNKAKAEMADIQRNLRIYQSISDSLKSRLSNYSTNTSQTLPMSTALSEIEELYSEELLATKQIEQAKLKIEVERLTAMNKRIKSIQNADEHAPLDLFNQKIRIVSPPISNMIKSTSNLSFAFIGVLLGFLIGVFSLMAKELKVK
jgi:hypothetical protein